MTQPFVLDVEVGECTCVYPRVVRIDVLTLCTCVNFLERVPVCIRTRTGEVGRGRRRPTSPDFAPVATPVFCVSSQGPAKSRGRYGSVFSSSGSCPLGTTVDVLASGFLDRIIIINLLVSRLVWVWVVSLDRIIIINTQKFRVAISPNFFWWQLSTQRLERLHAYHLNISGKFPTFWHMVWEVKNIVNEHPQHTQKFRVFPRNIEFGKDTKKRNVIWIIFSSKYFGEIPYILGTRFGIFR